MAAIERRAIAQLSADVAFGTGTTLFTADDHYLVSVIAVNMKATDGVIYVYVVPAGAISESEYGIISYSFPISGFNGYETYRFGVNPTDVIKVAGTAGVAFYLQGIDQVATVQETKCQGMQTQVI